MAFVSQERKASIAPAIKAALKKYGVKGSLSVHNHSTLVLTLKSGRIDFIKNFNETCTPSHPAEGSLQVNEYHFDKHFSGTARAFLAEVLRVMNQGNHDRSDIMTDYFDVGWYVNVNVGRWDKPYEVTK